MNKIVLVGYSGHAYVVADVLMQLGYKILGYLDKHQALKDPLSLQYLGNEQNEEDLRRIVGNAIFLSVGNNIVRGNLYTIFRNKGFELPKAICLGANISSYCKIGNGTLVCPGVSINSFASIGNAVIINTGAIIEHECIIDDFAHVAPGAVLSGDVKLGKGSFVGANAVIRQGVTIGNNVTIGAGAVVVKDIPDDSTYVGNPAKLLRMNNGRQ